MKLLNILISIIVLFFLTILVFFLFSPVFWGAAKWKSLQKIKTSKHYDGNRFQNLIPTSVETRSDDSPSMMESIHALLRPEENKNPSLSLPSVATDYDTLQNWDFAWLGHSTVVMRTQDLTLLTDPVFYNASPIPGTITPFDMEYLPQLKDLPNIDIVLISHDHYDHLDYRTIKQLHSHVKKFLVPLWVWAHLITRWVPDDKIEEYDWYDTTQIAWTNFVFTPTRHFSWRGLTNRNSTLWGSWVIFNDDQRIYYSWDSWYFDEFKNIWKKYWPFDIAFMENGAYNDDWQHIHMTPEESIQAAVDVWAKTVFPIHRGKFDLARHTWDEPISRATQEAEKKSITIHTPLIWEIFSTTSEHTHRRKELR